MNGAQVFFYGVAYGQYLAGVGGSSSGGGAGDDPNNRPWRPNKSTHEADAAAPRKKIIKKTSSSAAGEGPYPCPICNRRFDAVKALHGHQRSHPQREWRGMAPPRPPPPVAADGRQYRYACDRCGAPFETRQALGGHRASHSGKMGCYWLSRQQQPPAPMPVFAFDLNEPAQPEDEE